MANKETVQVFFDREDELQTNLDGEVCAQCRSLGWIDFYGCRQNGPKR
jgi:hypothetical protein